jgi:hypothetical protein
MDKAELLSQFQAKVDEFGRYNDFIEKAQSQSGRFAPEVVQKVISTNKEKMLGVVEALVPLTADVLELIEGYQTDRVKIVDSTESSTLRLQELELRLAIGELDDKGFEQESKDLRAELDSAQERIDIIDQDIAAFEGALNHWNDLGTRSGVLNAPVEPPRPPENEPASSGPPGLEDKDKPLVADGSDFVEIAVDPEVVDDLAMDPVDDFDMGVHTAGMTIGDDVSSVFDDDDDDDEDSQTRNGEMLVEDSAPELEGASLDILGDDEFLELDGGEGPSDIKPRRAVLLQAESSPDEQVHPVAKDVVSIGRGRDNDIQVRNDSKVSRYHCKIYRRGPNYYIEDNKSANGSLVNGELITERRLFGGEEIIVGETFFRFRIMD